MTLLNEKEIPEITVLRRALNRPVVLVGLMGSGKSRLGRKLAETLNVEFYDSDRVIEEKAGYPVAEIFRNDGETKFRDVEKRTMLELIDKGSCIIASGGGAVTSPDVLTALRQKAVMVWLKADPAELAERLHYAQDRPLLKNGDPAAVLRELADKREPLYAQAHITVETGGLSPHDAAVRLIKGLYGFLKPGNL